MANRSPPIPFDTGSINPSAAFAASAASTALPPRFRMSIPTCVASGTLVQTIPCRATTSERVAKFLPVMRSICAWARRSTINNRTRERVIRRIAKDNARKLDRQSLTTLGRTRGMNWKKFFIAFVAAFVFIFLFGFIWYGTLMNGAHMEVPALWRTEADFNNYFPWLILGHVIMAFFLTMLYARHGGGGAGSGACLGFL